MQGCISFLRRCTTPILAIALVIGSTAAANAQGVTLPDTGVDVEGAITALITAVGSVVSVAVLGYFAFLLVRKGMAWGRRAAG
jgi:hypothetical protein